MIQISKAHKMMGVPLREDIANLFPDAKRVTFQGNPTLVLPHGFVETKLLRNVGIEAPAPIMHHYAWPDAQGFTPFEVQKKTAELLTTNTRAYVLNGMGTGKTKSTLWAYDFLRQEGLARRMLVVAPLSTLNFVWAREVFRTLPHLSVSVLHGDKRKRLKRLAEEHDIYVVNPDGLGVIAGALVDRPDIDVVCIDEISAFRNGSSNRNKIARRITKDRQWVWGLTGTPTPQAPTDAWGQCIIVTPHTVPKYFGRFRDEVMNKVATFKHAPKEDATERVFKVMQPAVRYSLEDVTELPDLIERTVDVELGKRQGEIYETLRKHAYAAIDKGEVTAANAGAVLSKLLQVSLGYVYGKEVTEAGIEKVVHTLDNEARIEALIDAVNSTSEKVIVFAPFTHALAGIKEALAREEIEAAIIDGSTPKGDRDGIFAAFQGTSKYKVIAAHPATMSHGLTLTAADTIVWFGPTTSLEIFDQANARIRRIGQTKKQQILMFQGTSAEKRMYARLRDKQKTQDNLLDMFAGASE
ncbi:DEAD/DEAH box helicase [Methylobacterium sp. 285MFTsu5.1]|uniref:DEAD/DEAH box helicase n=1 Tax=Methylobacterium sp. 285MFTsu5.1 TaxID=1172187 RepID=UPI00035CC538|nr:DEAD/DEAH box helicase [Methylobacterium sp. 285MFTsu5.1]